MSEGQEKRDEQKNLKSIIELLEEVENDRTVPRNVRGMVEEIIKELKNDKEELTIRINSAISILDEISNDPNIPMYTRTQVWNIVSMLEMIQRE